VFGLLCRKDRERDPRDRERDSYRSVTTFAEKKDYRPDVKVEYVDDFGRMLDPKEVYFHTHNAHKNPITAILNVINVLLEYDLTALLQYLDIECTNVDAYI